MRSANENLPADRLTDRVSSVATRTGASQRILLAILIYLLEYFVRGVMVGLLLDGISEHGQWSQRYTLLDTRELWIDSHLVHRAVAQTAKHDFYH